MRSQSQLRHTRTRVRPRYALLPLEGYPPSVLPGWRDTEAYVLASPALGAAFVEYLLVVREGGGIKRDADGRTELFVYVLEGGIELTIDGESARSLETGGFALIPSTAGFGLLAHGGARLLALRKVFEPAPGVDPPPLVVGDVADVEAEVWMDIPGARLQKLIPDEIQHDLAMNIFTFDPGYSLPVVETHVMEHGLYFMEGKGLYYLDEEWMEVEAGDFIWMGPFVPQSFYATGTAPAKYLYYKNVNREIPL